MNLRDSEGISNGEKYTQSMEMNRKQNEAEVAAAQVTTEVTKEEKVIDEVWATVPNENHQNHQKTTIVKEAKAMDTEEEADLTDHRELEELLLE